MSWRRDHRNALWVLLWTGIYACVTVVHAASKLFWYDELLTLYVSGLDTFDDVWAALTSGFDLNPPLLYIITRALHQVFEPGEVVTRLPSMLGFWVMCLSLYAFLKRRLPVPYAFAGAAFPLLTGAYLYSYEARPYGILLGFAGLTLVFWQRATISEKASKADIAGFALSLGLCLMSHCYGVLLLMVFGLTELVRWVRRREISWAMAVAIIAATLPAMAVYFSLLDASRGVVLGADGARPHWLLVVQSYLLLLTPPAFFALPIAFAIVRFHPARRAGEPQPDQRAAVFTIEERVVLGLLAVLPLPALLLSASLVGQHYFRYALPCTIGVSALLAARLSMIARRSATPGWLTAIVFVGFFLSGVTEDVPKAIRGANQGYARLFLAQNPLLSKLGKTDAPLALSSCHDFFQVEHYGLPELVARSFYLVDHDAAIAHTGTDVCENGAEMIDRWFPIRSRVESYDLFLSNQEVFSVYTCSRVLEWLPPQIALDGLTVESQTVVDACSLLLVKAAGSVVMELPD